jgi:stage IV sporulation protein A
MNKQIYTDIAQRTDGDLYAGVVGPVRTGKSTFIEKFMNKTVIPNITSETAKERAITELPQSSAGKTIMTTEPKFVPEKAVDISIGDIAKAAVRLIDCVGYIVPSALGYIEDDAPRMVKTPWFEDEIPFAMAAEVGTQKVINDHSTFGVVVTTDGSISDIPKEEYSEATDRVVDELQAINKPFVVVYNCVNPETEKAQAEAAELTEKYNTPVLPMNVLEMNEGDINNVLEQVLYSFPIKEINIKMPKWVTGLDKGHWLKSDLFSAIRGAAEELVHVRDTEKLAEAVKASEHVSDAAVTGMDLGKGSATVNIDLKNNLFYKVLGEETGIEILSESDLMPLLKDLTDVKKKYQKIENALAEVEATGYGIVMPTLEELHLEEPEIVKQGGKYGIRLRASAPSIHLMRADIQTEVSPIVGSEKQSEELVMYLLREFEESPQKIWQSNIFGKSLHELVNEGLQNKLHKMPVPARMKLQETLERIINEGCGGLICFIL